MNSFLNEIQKKALMATAFILTGIWIYFVLFPQIRDYYVVNYTSPQKTAIQDISSEKHNGSYIELEGVFLPQQGRKLVEKEGPPDSLGPEKEVRRFYLFCKRDRSACVYYGVETENITIHFDNRLTTIRGFIRELGDEHSRQMLFLRLRESSDFRQRYPIKPVMKPDGTYDWQDLVSQYHQRARAKNSPLAPPTGLYIHEGSDFGSGWIMIFLCVASIGVFFIAGGMFSAGRKEEE